MTPSTARAAVADLGIGNLRSIVRALDRLGVPADVVPPADLLDAELAVLPGVGGFGPAARNLAPVRDDLRAALEDGLPCIGICLGLQALFEESEEADGEGLGFFAGRVERFPPGPKVPHMGWSPVRIEDPELADGLPEQPYFYFAHSYHPVPAGAEDVTVATCEYGRPFAAAVRRAHTVGFQFHPEKSGDAGLTLLGNALDALGVER